MRKTILLFTVCAATAVLTSGCAGPEKKLGRGFRNFSEIVRGGEMRRSVEQTAMTDGPEVAYTTGSVKGFNRTMARTGIGLFEILTFPFPSYDPVATDYLTPNPVYPDAYRPKLRADPSFNTDTYVGFSGGDIAPAVPGSRFFIFED